MTGKQALTEPGALARLDEGQRRAVAAEVADELGAAFEPADLMGSARAPSVVHRPSNIVFVLMPAAVFEMGLTREDLTTFERYFTGPLDDDDASELQYARETLAAWGAYAKPARLVTVLPFAIASSPVNQDQLAALTGVRPASMSFETPEHARRAFAPHGLRLPSEAEWEYVARGSPGGVFLHDALATYLGLAPFCSADTVTGVRGLIGEWVDDPWHDGYDGAPDTSVPFRLPTDAADAPGVVRGNASSGQCLSGEAEMFIAYRFAGHVQGRPPAALHHQLARPAFGPDSAGRWRLAR